jgi:RNA polymerase sigma factor (sigma-70 family)
MNDSACQRTRERNDERDGRSPSEAVVAALAEHGRWLRTVLAARGVERSALDDVMQDVASEAMRCASQLRDPSRAAAWLYRLAVLQVLRYRRRIGRRRKLAARLADSGAAPGEAVEHDPLAWLLAEEAQRMVRQAVATLPARDAEILLLKYTEDWSYQQLAGRLGISTSALEARLHRARGRLRAALARLAPELIPGR